MAKVYREYQPDQAFLLPPSLRDWLPERHLAYFISEVVDEMDVSELFAYYEREERGQPAYHPRMMTKILLYAYCKGVQSSRKIAQRLEEDVAFRVLAANNQPDFRTVSDFRKIHLESLKKLFLQVLRLCQKARLVKLGYVALDGTKVKANASKHKAMSYGRMCEAEKELEEEVNKLLVEAQRIDEEEDRLYGADRRGDELPKELARRETRLKRIREAKAALEAEARRKARGRSVAYRGLPGESKAFCTGGSVAERKLNVRTLNERPKTLLSGAYGHQTLKSATPGCFKNEPRLIFIQDFGLLIGLLCSFQSLDRYVTEHDRIAVAGKTKIARSAVLAGMRSVSHVFADLAQVRVKDNGAVQLNLDG